MRVPKGVSVSRFPQKSSGTELAETGDGSGRVGRLLKAIADATRLVSDAERAYRLGDSRAGRLHAASECAHRDLLQGICELSESEADFVEPGFTGFESRLLRLP